MNNAPNSKLTEFDIRPTKQRAELVQLLFQGEKPRHVTAEGLYQEAQAQGYQISQATVYNCLHLFCQAGLIREIAIEGQKSFYDTKPDGHPHFYHVSSGVLVDAPHDVVKVEIAGEVPDGKTVSGIDVVIRLEDQDIQN